MCIRDRGSHINCVHVKDEVGFPNIIQSQHVWFGGGLVDLSLIHILWRSLVARTAGGREVAGSNPVAPIILNM